jgi:two-component system sensor histidine kinase AlgZ
VRGADYSEGGTGGPAVGATVSTSDGAAGSGRPGPGLLPDFCTRDAIFAAVLLGELLAILITLAEWRPRAPLLTPLALNSLFVLWVTLSSCALLCWLGRRSGPHGAARTLIVAFLGILGVSWLLSELAWLGAGVPVLGGGPSGDGHGYFLLRNLGLTGLIAAMSLRYLYVQQAWRRQVLAGADARMAALQARIRPHFLFNSLNTIAALVASDPRRAEDAVQDLADLFRAALAAPEDLAPLADELLLCERYVALETLRLGERLQVAWALADDLPREEPVPPLILQPLLENAIYHGVEGLAAGGTVRVTGKVAAGRVHFTIDNPCPPAIAAEGQASQPGAAPRVHLGIALANIRDRLQAHYGAAGGLEATRLADRFRVSIWWPTEECPT